MTDHTKDDKHSSQPMKQPKQEKESLTDYTIRKFREAGIILNRVEPPKDQVRVFFKR